MLAWPGLALSCTHPSEVRDRSLLYRGLCLKKMHSDLTYNSIHLNMFKTLNMEELLMKFREGSYDTSNFFGRRLVHALAEHD